MTGEAEELIHAHLDGMIDPASEAALSAWLAASPEKARFFATTALLHDRLRHLLVAQRELASEQTTNTAPVEPARQSRHFRVRSFLLVGSLVVSVVVLMVMLPVPGPVSAAAELDRLIDAPAPIGDRTYRITSRDPVPDVGDDRQPPLDGAVLYVRNPDNYVLVRRFPDGRPFITGSDGERGWSVKPDGAVRVSGDPLRFRGPLPGNQYGIPFIDPRSDLRHLRDAYAVSTLRPAGVGRWGLLFEKRSAEYRGPRRVEVWYDPQTRVVHRMEFDGLPACPRRAEGGIGRVDRTTRFGAGLLESSESPWSRPKGHRGGLRC